MSNPDKGPLDGILVVALEQAVAAPFATSRLADAGARVIKVEREGPGDFARAYDTVVDGDSAYFVWLNRGKESVQIDIKSDEGRELLDALLAKADVFIQNLAPDATVRMGLGSADLRARHPRLITCDITGYGEDGPMKNAKAYDLLVQCESGLASITGTPDAPGRVGVSVCDISTGMTAHAGILEALLERERTGKGRGVAVAMFDTLADWMSVPLMFHELAQKETPRTGLFHSFIVPYGSFPCGDGNEIVLSVQNPREWANFAEFVLGDRALADDPRFASNADRLTNKAELETMIRAAFAKHDRPEMLAILQKGKIASGAVNDVADLSVHPQVDRISIETPKRTVSIPAPPIRRSDSKISLNPVPAVGQHSAQIIAEFLPKG